MVKVSIPVEKSKYSNYVKGGLDIGKTKIYCYLKSPSGKTIKVFSFDNNLIGFTICYEKIESFKKTERLAGVLLGVESTGTYGDPVTEWLMKKGIKVVGVNPKHVHRMKEVIDNSPLKSDKKDPVVITTLLELGRFHQILQPQGLAAELRIVAKHRKQLKVNENRIFNQLESHVVRIFPELLQVMRGLDRVTTIYLLEHHTLPGDIVQLGYEKLLEVIKQKSRYQLGEDRTRALLNVAKQSIGVKEGVLSISLAIRDLIKNLRLVKEQIKEAELMLENLLADHEEAEYIRSLPGIGIITASEIIGETGGVNNYSNPNKLTKLAGLNLYEVSSGIHVGRKRITKRGRSALRQTLYMAALRMVKKGGLYKTEYEAHLKTMKKPQALVVISKKLIRVIFALVKKKELFDAEYQQVSVK